QAIHMIIGGSDMDWLRAGAGGVAPFEGFTRSEKSNEGFVFSADSIDAGSTALNAADRHYIAESVAHEAGHLFGLSHQSVVSSNVVITEYSTGDSSTVPIMGASNVIRTTRGIWFSGQTSVKLSNGQVVPNGPQDDLAVMTRPGTNIHYRVD